MLKVKKILITPWKLKLTVVHVKKSFTYNFPYEKGLKTFQRIFREGLGIFTLFLLIKYTTSSNLKINNKKK